MPSLFFENEHKAKKSVHSKRQPLHFSPNVLQESIEMQLLGHWFGEGVSNSLTDMRKVLSLRAAGTACRFSVGLSARVRA